MKKILHCASILRIGHATKTIRIMKWSILLLIIPLVQISANVYNQEAHFSLRVKNSTYQEIFKKIESETNFRFVYKDELLNNLDLRSVSFIERNINEVLGELFHNTNLKYRILEDGLIVLEKTMKQTFPVQGKVSDSYGEALPGVNILEQGTSNGTVTNINGEYSINVSSENAALIFSYVGYLSEEVSINGQSTIDITLVEDIRELSEVVVIGYGTQKKSDLTGAISSVKVEDLQKIPVTNVDQALMGQAAGVQVTSNSGEPGGGASIRIRGVGTINSAEPLYVIDGIPVDNSFSQNQTLLITINPADIESMEVLKDASATAIYGARAQNGVVIITTKRGRKGELNLEFESQISMNVLNQNIDMMTGNEWAAYYQDAINSVELNINEESQLWLDSVNNGLISPQTYDWIDAATRKAITQNYQISASGGSEASTFALTAGYLKQEGIFRNNFLERFSFRLNSDHEISRRLKVGNTLTVSRTESETNGAGDPDGNDKPHIRRLMEMNPFRSIYNEDGEYADLPDFASPFLDHTAYHPLWGINERKQYRINNRILGSLFAEYEIIKGLTFKSMFSIDTRLGNNSAHNPWNDFVGNASTEVGRSSVIKDSNEALVWYLDNTLTYQKSFGNHNLTALLGNQTQQNNYKGFSASGTSIPNNDFPFIDFTTDELTSVNDWQSRSSWLSVFGRLLYDYNGKYLLTATVRRDGSSNFGENKRFGTFPAASIGWKISEEDFFTIAGISNLKLRISYGITGNEAAGNYQTIPTVGSGTSGNYDYDYVFGADNIMIGRTLLRLPNESLQWEETKQTNIGFDAGFYRNRINLSVDYFKKITDNMFMAFTPPVEVGTEENPKGNLGQITNSGLEAVFSSVNLTGAFKWNTSLNFTVINNNVDKLANEDAPRYNGVNTTQVGYEVGALYAFETDGVFQNWEEVYAHAYQNQERDADAEAELAANLGPDDPEPVVYDTESKNAISFTAPGDIRFIDKNGDGIINDDDKAIMGSTIPDFFWGMTNIFSFNNFNLTVFLQGVHGIDIYNSLRIGQEGMSGSGPANVRSSVRERWTGEGTSDVMPRLNINDPNNNNRVSDRWIEDGSFVRLKNVRLSYNLPENWMNALRISNASIYLNSTNLLTFTKYKGFDPEVGYRNPSRSETGGTDSGNYPLSRQYTIGLQINF